MNKRRGGLIRALSVSEIQLLSADSFRVIKINIQNLNDPGSQFQKSLKFCLFVQLESTKDVCRTLLGVVMRSKFWI